jgi:hypothetical protein
LLAGAALATRTSPFGRRRGSLRSRRLALSGRVSSALRERYAGRANGGDGQHGDETGVHSHDFNHPPTEMLICDCD